MKIRIAISVSIVAALAVVLIATAQSRTASCQAPQRPAGGPPPPPPPPLMNEHLARELNLSDEQNAQVKAVFDADHSTVEGLMK